MLWTEGTQKLKILFLPLYTQGSGLWALVPMPWLRLYLFLPHWNDLEVSTQHKRVDCIETLTATVLATALRRLPNDGRKGSGSRLRLPRIITFTIIIGRLPSGICLRSWLLAWAPPCIHTGTDRQKWNYLEERTFALQYVLYPKYFLVCLFVYQKDMLVVTLNWLTASYRVKNKSLQAYLKQIGLQLRSRRNIKSDSVISPGAL